MTENNATPKTKTRYIIYGVIFMVGLLLGWLLFGTRGHNGDAVADSDSTNQIWTCSMHPQIRKDKPGKCDLCGMDLIPLKTGSSSVAVGPDEIQLSEEAIALANIQTTVVSMKNPIKTLHLYGEVLADERLSGSQTSHVAGRIEKLFINFTGESVRVGQRIATIYSPDLLKTQQELLEAKMMQSESLIEAAKEKLRLWKFTDSEIAEMEQSGKSSPYVDIKATVSGIVMEKYINQGDYVNQGDVLFSVANLSSVWVLFDAYESDLPFVNVGDNVKFTLQAVPERGFSGKVSFINPVVDKTSRTTKIRVEASNPGMLIKPGMYAEAEIVSPLKQYNDKITVPKSAVLWTGKRSVVYLKDKKADVPIFKMVQIELGPSLGEDFVVVSGLHEGDEVVTNGVFSIDASAQLEGKQSMMNVDVEMDDSNKNPNIRTETLRVEGLCDMCKETIEQTSLNQSGVSKVVWNKDSKQLNLTFDSSVTTVKKISQSIALAGYDTALDKAPQESYNALPECCKYRDN